MQYQPIPGVMVIGFGHKARNGKDTAAKVFQDYFGSKAFKVAFADALKAVCRVCFGMTHKDGPLLQMVGTDLYRRMNPSVWTDAVYWTIDEVRPRIVLIPDVRFPNEADMVKAMGGQLIRCTRTINGQQYIDPSRSATHPSETALDGYEGWDWDFVAEDVGTLNWLATRAVKAIGEEIGIRDGLWPSASL